MDMNKSEEHIENLYRVFGEAAKLVKEYGDSAKKSTPQKREEVRESRLRALELALGTAQTIADAEARQDAIKQEKAENPDADKPRMVIKGFRRYDATA